MDFWCQIASGLAALWLAAAPPATGQPESGSFAEVGHVHVQSYLPADYDAGPSNWAAVQDVYGLLYVGNNDGVLVYDGVTWELLRLPNRGVVRSLDTDGTGRVFVGGYDTFGVLHHDTNGVIYQALSDSLPPEQRSFADVWATVVGPDGTYFVSPRRLFRWSDEHGLESWHSAALMRKAARLHDTVFVHREGRGLAAMRGGRLQHVRGTEALAEANVYLMAPADPGRLLIGTRTAGLFVFDGTRLVRLPTDADDQLDALQLHDGLVLPDGSIALATRRGGILWLSETGRLLRIFDQASGLSSSDVKALYYDDQNGLWAATGNGVARLPLPSPLTFFTEEDGFRGSVYSVLRHGGDLHVGTSQGVFVMHSPEAPGRPPRFAPIRGLEDSCQALLSTGSELLAGCSGAIYRIGGGRAVRIAEPGITYVLAPSPSDPERLYAGLNEGVAVLRRENGEWHVQRHVDEAEQVRMVVEDRRRNVWLGTNHGGVYRLRLDERDRVTRLDHYDRWADQRVHVFEVDGEPLFSIRHGLFRYDSAADAADPFVPDSAIADVLTGNHQNIFRLSERTSGDLLLRSGGESGLALRQDDGSYRWTTTPLSRLPEENVYGYFAEDDGVSWVGGADGLFRHDARVANAHVRDFPVRVRQVDLVGGDSTLYRGIETAAALPERVGYASNSVRFTFAAPRFEAPEATRYRVRLRGFDSDWSSWTSETRKDYTNLPEGRYAFDVQARDVYGRLSDVGTATFAVLPPWHRTWWAYSIYTLLGLALFAGAVRWRSARLQERARQLEAEVAARTEEVARQNAQLEAQAERLAALDAAKSRFFANISHEFRTPLTLTLGPVEDILTGAHGTVSPPIEGRLQMVHRNASRLLRLINQLLDLAKLETGHVRLEAAKADLVETLEALVLAFSPLAERRQIALTFEPAVETLHAYADPDKLEKVVANLLSNAFKATSEGGSIYVRLRLAQDRAEIEVEDTGTGIAPADLPTIFDRFNHRAEGTWGGTGTGIGLNLTKEFVELHGGTIDVVSTPGVGTTFLVRLPIGRAHLRDDQLADAPEADPIEPPSAGHAPSAPEAASAPPSPTDDGPTVLVVDDNADIRTYVRAQLATEYHVAEASDGVEGFERAKALLPDCIIADVMMPRRDGYGLTEALKSDPDLDHVPLILLTAKADDDHKIEGLATGADDYVTKPFNARELAARVRNLIASRHRLREKFSRLVVMRPTEVSVDSADEQFLEQVKTAIEAHMTDETFSVADLAGVVALSESQLQRKTKALTDRTPVQLIRTMRLERAAQLLDQEAGTITEIAYAVGFNSYAHFARSFKRHFGRSASEYMAG